MRYLIKNGSIIDPARRVATVGNVLVEEGKVTRVIDLADLTMESEQLTEGVEIIGAITIGRAGTTLTEMAELVEAGCVGFSDDGSPVSDPAVMRNALAYAAMLAVPIMSHCEELSLSRGWAMHEGVVSTRLGLPGYPSAAEEVQIAREIALAELTGAHIHICHVSTAGGVALIRAAKERGVRVTAEVTPHHLTLTDRWVLGPLGAFEQPAAAPPERREARGRRRKKIEPGIGLPGWLDPTLL